MIFITGDTHGDFTRFSSQNFPEQQTMTKKDYVIVCGDFGGIWNGSKEEEYWLDWLDEKPFTTLFVTGNHENYDLLKTYPFQYWNGGKVQRIRPSILHLTRGQIFEISGRTFFTMGGASSHDISDGILDPNDPNFKKKKRQLDANNALYRINHRTWWEEELPLPSEYEEAERNLEQHGRTVDFMVSHCCPSSILDLISEGAFAHDTLTDYFESLKNNCQFHYWFFGHYHDNGSIQRKYILLYEQIIQLIP